MAIEFDIQVRNGTVKITVGGLDAGNGAQDAGGHGKNSGTGTGGHGKNSGTGTGGHGKNSGTGTGGGESEGSSCCAPMVIGPIVLSGAGDQSNNITGGHGKNSGTGTGGHGKNSGTGTGGAENASDKGMHAGGGSGCCCAPVVIGPIVISGCYSNDDDGASTGQASSEAVTVNPPASTHGLAPTTQSFIMQYQQQTNWCWAAVAVSVNEFLDPQVSAVGLTWTQPTLANQLLIELGVAAPPCSETPGSRVCNQPQALDLALAITRNLRPNGVLSDKHLTFDCIQSWVNVQLPVAARIKWRGAGAHFIALDGFKVMSSGQQLVHVQDPDPHTSPTLWDYDALVENYQQEGYWSDTYLVMASKPQG